MYATPRRLPINFLLDERASALWSAQSCRFHWVLLTCTYSINALLFVFMKTQGISSKDIRQTHVKQELERVKAFIKKIKGAEELSKGPKLVLDKDASKRFIQSALSTDQVYIDAVKTRKGDQDSTEAQSPMGDQLKKRATAKPCSKKSKRQRKR
ncbi:unnamed protein product [Peronospora belbahrii]|uniref:Nuclear nucleic acid-binding protein C1D n=1 Tax=Peronospora belbahrii TaxID=622444 RepID=A0ABN8CRL7_9STRA|nr:unnamed protein product [Peronospora belbahrii]